MDRHYRGFSVRLHGVSRELDHNFLVNTIERAIATSAIYPNGVEYPSDVEVEIDDWSGDLIGSPDQDDEYNVANAIAGTEDEQSAPAAAGLPWSAGVAIAILATVLAVLLTKSCLPRFHSAEADQPRRIEWRNNDIPAPMVNAQFAVAQNTGGANGR